MAAARTAIAVTFVVAVVAGFAAAGATAPPASPPDEQVTAQNATVGADERTNLSVVLTEAPDGLAGFELTVELDTPGVANVTGVAYPDRFGLRTEPRIGTDRQSVTVEAADLNDSVGPGGTDVTLATVGLTGDEGGSTAVSIVDAQVDADGGDRIAAGEDPEGVTVELLGQEETAASDPTNDDTAGADRESTAQRDPDEESSAADDAETDTGSAGTPGVLLVGGALGLLVALVAIALAVMRQRR